MTRPLAGRRGLGGLPVDRLGIIQNSCNPSGEAAAAEGAGRSMAGAVLHALRAGTLSPRISQSTVRFVPLPVSPNGELWAVSSELARGGHLQRLLPLQRGQMFLWVGDGVSCPRRRAYSKPLSGHRRNPIPNFHELPPGSPRTPPCFKSTLTWLPDPPKKEPCAHS